MFTSIMERVTATQYNQIMSLQKLRLQVQELNLDKSTRK